MEILGLSITRSRGVLSEALAPVRSGAGLRGIWSRLISEPSTGAWQRNESLETPTVLGNPTVFACVDLIARDIAKLLLRLVEQDKNGIWTPVESSAFSPVLRKPNRYQTRIQFIEQWLSSKLTFGNTYVLKQRDDRNVVNGMYVLDPSRVTPMVSTSGDVYYELRRDDLSELRTDSVIVPASEIMHDRMVTLFHPLVGVTPIFACGLAAMQGLKIQDNSNNFFANAARPSGILVAKGDMSDEDAANLKAYYQANFTGPKVGSLLLLTNGMEYKPVTVNPVDAQLIEQLQWSAETICSCFHVPPYKVVGGQQPTYNNVEALNQQYYSQCLQSLIESLELVLDEGLELPRPYGTEFDLDDLLRMDTESKSKAAAEGIGAGAMAPNEARKRFFGLGPVEGGETPYLQQQNYSLAALAARDASGESITRTPAPPAVVEPPPVVMNALEPAALLWAIEQKAQEVRLYG